jgi:hypothetical protein
MFKPHPAHRMFLCLALLVAGRSGGAETRFHEYSEKFGHPTDGATVVSASFFGGIGNEWLAAGGFAPDGTVVLAGNVIGPEFQEASVLGRDGPKPKTAIRQPELDSKGNPKTNKDGSPTLKKTSWQDAGVTGYIIRASADLKSTLSTHRLPWESGAITSCAVAQDGAIYLAGKANDSIVNLTKDTKELRVNLRSEKQAACDHTFIAKLSADASQVVWLRHAEGPSNTPKIAILPDGSLTFTAQSLWNLSTTGAEIGNIEIPGGPGPLVAVNPKDGSIARGGEHHSPTGREPWRCPTLNVYSPDGSQRHQFYEWLGPYVGLDNLRLVSDTSVRRVTFDPDGNLFLYLWSDGGNSVALREPYDIRKFAPNFGGLGFEAWGAGVLSAAYLVRINPKTYQVKDGTMWLAYLETVNKPNTAWIDQLAFAPDGSVCFTGRAASSIIQTSNRLSPSNSDQHIVILQKDLKSIRFSSTVPGSGQTRTGDGDETWGIASATSGGKQRVLFLTGASEGEGEFKTPTVNANQNSFGGGWMDGYAVLLEMETHSRSTTEPFINHEDSDWQAVPNSQSPSKPESFVDSKGRGPQAGQNFRFEPDKWVTVDAEFRDPTNQLWPSFFYGNPIGGVLTFEPTHPSLHCKLGCDRVCLPNDDPSGRVAGEWTHKDGVPLDFSFEIKSMSTFQTVDETQKRGKSIKKQKVLVAMVDAVITANKKTIPVKAECQFKWQYPSKSNIPNSVQIDALFTTTGKILGLKNPKAAGEIKVRVSAVGNSQATDSAKNPK